MQEVVQEVPWAFIVASISSNGFWTNNFVLNAVGGEGFTIG